MPHDAQGTLPGFLLVDCELRAVVRRNNSGPSASRPAFHLQAFCLIGISFMSKWMRQGGTASVLLTGLQGGLEGYSVGQGPWLVFVSVTVVSWVVNIIIALLSTNQSIFSWACPPQGFEVGWREAVHRCRELERDHWP